MSQNPYEPPKGETTPPGAEVLAQTGTCPKCQQSDYKQLKFTWWGGALGPRMFHHVKCNGCGATFNSKTGKSNTTAIAIYSVVVTAIAILLFVFVFRH